MAPRFGGYSKEGLEWITDGYSQDNFIGNFQFGKVYRGKSGWNRPLVVKVWDRDEVDGCKVWPEDNEARLRDESCLTYDDRVQFHPNMIEISGVSWLGSTPTMAYEIDALDILHNLLDKDNFSWLHRVNVALGIASFVKCLHGCKPLPYLVRNISAAHIILDKDYNAKLYDFSMISGGILADKTELLNQRLQGCYGYVDPDYVCRGIWSKKCDVFAFGVVLISLISKRVQTEANEEAAHEPFLYEWAHNECQKKGRGSKVDPFKFSLVHKSFEAEPLFWGTDGIKLTKLAMQCVDYNPTKRPTLKQIINSIRELSAVQETADIPSPVNMKAARRLSISALHRSVIKSIKVTSDLKAAASEALFKYLVSEDKLVSACKGAFEALFKYQANEDKLVVSACKDREYVAPYRLSYEDIKCYTNGFSEENFIDIYPFGKLYHGSIDSRNVTVKTWEDIRTHYIEKGDNEIRLRDELTLLQHPTFVSHPHIVKMIGYCYENEKLSAVYNLQSLDSLFNLITKDSFTWNMRIMFILELAELLKYLQQKNPPYLPYVLRNIAPGTILVDKNYKPKLFDFGMLLGGIMNDQKDYRIRHVHWWDYYIDPYTNCYDYYTEVSDIYSFGMVVLNLVTKIVFTDAEVEFEEWVRNEYERAKGDRRQSVRRFSFVEDKFCNEVDFDLSDGRRVTKLAMQCINIDYSKRPTINQVIKQLKKLKIMSSSNNS